MAAEIDRYADAITRIESGGRYDALGPVTRTGDRAYGRYQVMGANVPSWTEEAGLGRMTPEQFAANPQAQDAVFRHRFGQYVQRYGPEGAAAAWFAGEGGMNNPNARDQLGTSVADYRQRFTQGLGGQPAAPSAGAPAAETTANPGAQSQQPQDIDSIVADTLRGRERDTLANTAAVGAATDDTPLQLPQMSLPQFRVPGMAPRRAVTTEQLRAALPRRLGV